MLQNFKNIAVVSFSTVGSRLLGLLRDVLVFATLGASLWNSAFILAFTLPNLFRRLLGEGALTSAVVPLFSDILEKKGRTGAFRFLNQVLLRLFLALLLIVGFGMCTLAWAGDSDWMPQRWALGTSLAVWLFPYMLLICLAAIICAGLNIMGRFATAALTPIVLNLAMIIALVAGMWLDAEASRIVYWLCAGVLIGGLLQLLLPSIDLVRQGWRPRLVAQSDTAMSELWKLFLPGLMGAAILQTNILISRLLAFSLDESAVSVLYLASRLMELPLGVFTISVATVFFPLLAKALSTGDDQAFSSSFLQGLRLVVGISLPAAVGLCVLGEPIIECLFHWGSFNQSDVTSTVPLLAIYGIGLPFYSIATFITRGLHASKDMITPVRVAVYCLTINLLVGIILMQFIGAAGLATANVLAAIAQSYLLWRVLSSRYEALNISAIFSELSKVILAGAVMGTTCLLLSTVVSMAEMGAKTGAILTVAIGVPSGASIYFALLYLLRFKDLDMIKSTLVRNLPSSR